MDDTYRVVFIKCDAGNTPRGEDWERFMRDQEAALNTLADEGFHLVAAVPLGGEDLNWVAGVLLYLRRAAGV